VQRKERFVFTFDLDDFELAPTGPGLRVSFPLHSATGTASTATVLFELDPALSFLCTRTAQRSS
jgi:hypothetical protein